jgi:hypothetical protein
METRGHGYPLCRTRELSWLRHLRESGQIDCNQRELDRCMRTHHEGAVATRSAADGRYIVYFVSWGQKWRAIR